MTTTHALPTQLYALYAKAQEARNLASIIGAEELTAYATSAISEFARDFDQRFVGQGKMKTEASSGP